MAATTDEKGRRHRRRHTVRAANIALIQCISDEFQPQVAEALAAVICREAEASRGPQRQGEPTGQPANDDDTLCMFDNQEVAA